MTDYDAVGFEEKEFLVRNKWERTSIDTWRSPKMDLEVAIQQIIKLGNLNSGVVDKVRESLAPFASLTRPDYWEIQRELYQLLPDVYDTSRWTFEASEHKVLVEFNIDTESALDMAGYNEIAQRAYAQWHVVETSIETVMVNEERNNQEFESVARTIWKMWNDQDVKNAMGWKYWQDVFREEQVKQFISIPKFVQKIDLRNEDYANQNRLMFVLKLDAQFPDRHTLLADHLTPFTQKHRTELTELMERVAKEEVTQEQADTIFEEVMSGEGLPESEQDPKVSASFSGRDIYFDGEPAIRILPELDSDDPAVLKLKSRVLEGRVNFTVNFVDGAVLASDKDETKKIGNWIGKRDDPKQVEWMQKRGISVVEF